MSRVQLALNVESLDDAVDFYRKLFATEPAKRRPGYASERRISSPARPASPTRPSPLAACSATHSPASPRRRYRPSSLLR